MTRVLAFLEGPAFTYVILALYAARCLSYAGGGHYGRVCYWLCAFGITLSAEFLITRWP